VTTSDSSSDPLESGVRNRLLQAATKSSKELQLPTLPIADNDDADPDQTFPLLRKGSPSAEGLGNDKRKNNLEIALPALPKISELENRNDSENEATNEKRQSHFEVAVPPPVPRIADDTNAPSVESHKVTCPKCQARLITPETLGYCSACGYCRSLDPDAELKADDFAPVAADTTHSPPSLIGWLAILLGGMFAVLLYCKSLDFLVSESSETRALWGTGLLAGGIVVLYLSQLWAYWKLASENVRLGVSEMLIPSVSVWAGAFRRLPETRWPVWLAGWSLAIILGATVVIGGQSWWFEEHPAPKYQTWMSR
jgi:hypothetical protein